MLDRAKLLRPIISDSVPIKFILRILIFFSIRLKDRKLVDPVKDDVFNSHLIGDVEVESCSIDVDNWSIINFDDRALR